MSFLLPAGSSAFGRRGFAPFGVVWLAFIGIWGSQGIRGNPSWSAFAGYIPLILIGVGMFALPIVMALSRLGITISRDGLTWTRRVLFWTRRVTVPLEDVGECRIEGPEESFGYGYRSRSRRSMRMPTRLALDAGVRTLRFGEVLSEREREWLRDAINEELRIARRK